jgi:hypothetical protein
VSFATCPTKRVTGKVFRSSAAFVAVPTGVRIETNGTDDASTSTVTEVVAPTAVPPEASVSEIVWLPGVLNAVVTWQPTLPPWLSDSEATESLHVRSEQSAGPIPTMPLPFSWTEAPRA